MPIAVLCVRLAGLWERLRVFAKRIVLLRDMLHEERRNHLLNLPAVRANGYRGVFLFRPLICFCAAKTMPAPASLVAVDVQTLCVRIRWVVLGHWERLLLAQRQPTLLSRL